MNFKNIHIGSMIKQRTEDYDIDYLRLRNIFKCTNEEIDEMYLQAHLSADLLLKWSKLLEYDFFRIYSQHLILYAPPSHSQLSKEKSKNLPKFRKNIYTKEVIDFILNQIETKEISINHAITKYKIPKTTLYKWIAKNKE